MRSTDTIKFATTSAVWIGGGIQGLILIQINSRKMKAFRINILRLILAAAFGLSAYWLLAISIDGVTKISPHQSLVNDLAETLLFLISPLAFGVLVVLAFVVISFLLLPLVFKIFKR